MLARSVAAAIAVLCLLAPRVGDAQTEATPPATPVEGPMAHAVDQLFAQWAGPDSPRASIAIIQNGKIVYSQGYGAANLEYGVPNSPATVFPLV
jgi:CubicO group peptidase (beta-lactamase class C family)